MRGAASIRRPRPAFTLVELLVVIAIMAVLIGLLFSAVQKVRASAARALCANRLRQISLALHSYHGTHGAFPPGCTVYADKGANQYMNWQVRILPWMEQEALHRQALDAFRAEPLMFHLPPHPVATVLPAYECPSDPRSGMQADLTGIKFGMTAFLGVSGSGGRQDDGVLFADSRIRFDEITDGASNTLLLGERPTSANSVYGWWYAGIGQDLLGSIDAFMGATELCRSPKFPGCPRGPYEFGPGRLDNTCDAFHFWSLHSGGAHFAFADGSVRFLSYGAKDVLPALATRAGGEVVEVP